MKHVLMSVMLVVALLTVSVVGLPTGFVGTAVADGGDGGGD